MNVKTNVQNRVKDLTEKYEKNKLRIMAMYVYVFWYFESLHDSSVLDSKANVRANEYS